MFLVHSLIPKGPSRSNDSCSTKQQSFQHISSTDAKSLLRAARQELGPWEFASAFQWGHQRIMPDFFHCGHSFAVLITYTPFCPQWNYNWYIFAQVQLFFLILCFNNRSGCANILAGLNLCTFVVPEEENCPQICALFCFTISLSVLPINVIFWLPSWSK